MNSLSKSKLLAFRQCPRRLWLEVHRPSLRQDSAASQAVFAAGHQVGELARKLYDPQGLGRTIELQPRRYTEALTLSQSLLHTAAPVFEAGFAARGAIAFADVMLPQPGAGWRMVEVKSTTGVKDYQLDDVAIQSYVARAAGVQLTSVAIAHIDSSWVYPGMGDYRGLLAEVDLTAQAFARHGEVEGWIAEAHAVAAQPAEPPVPRGQHCKKPYECGFSAHCGSSEPVAEFPVSWLPRIASRALRAHVEAGARDMREVPDALLNAAQLRVKRQTLSGERYFDAAGAADALAPNMVPACFLDFETIAFAVPVWAGTRPYQMIPFQFSAHWVGPDGKVCSHAEFLDLTGNDPSLAFAEALIEACGTQGPVYVFNQSFESTRMRELAERFEHLAPALQAIRARLVDLHPVAEKHFYDPSQQGSWSIKKVLPAVAPELRYDQLDGVQDGGAAMEAYLEAIAAGTPPPRREQIRRQLLQYCHLDTLAMVRLWQFFSGLSSQGTTA